MKKEITKHKKYPNIDSLQDTIYQLDSDEDEEQFN